MKNHKKKERTVSGPWDAIPLGDFINHLYDASAGMMDCTIQIGYSDELVVAGWVPMTEKEIEKAEARRLASKAANAAKKAKKEAEERALLEKLKEKYD